MKKKVITLFCAAAVFTAACGDKEFGGSTSVSDQKEQYTEEGSGTESSAENEPESNEEGSGEELPNPERGSAVDDVQGSEEESVPEEFDWASVDWDSPIVLWGSNHEYVNAYTHGMILSMYKAEFKGDKDVLMEVIEENEDNLIEETAALLNEIRKLSYDEVIYIQETYTYAEEIKSVEEKTAGFDWALVDWKREFFPSEDVAVGMQDMSGLLSAVLWKVQDKNDMTMAEYISQHPQFFGNKTYDDLDDEAKAVCEELLKLSKEELRYMSEMYTHND